MPTPEAQAMAAIVAEHAPLLRSSGFRKRRHSFNRPAADGLVHVVTFWMAPKEPPAWTEVPGLRERLYGSFRIDVGVHVPEMTRMHTPRSTWINEYECHLRRTVGELLPDAEATSWWRLDDPSAPARAGQALEEHVLPWLDRFPDRDAVLAAFEAVGPLPLGLGPAGALDVADLLRATGSSEEERRVLEDYVARPVLAGHAAYLSEYLARWGHGDLSRRIRVREEGPG